MFIKISKNQKIIINQRQIIKTKSSYKGGRG